MVSVAGMANPAGSCRHPPLPNKPGTNWVERTGGLPRELDCIARALFWGRGHDEGKAVRIAWGVCRNWARGQGNVSAATRARCAAAIARIDAQRAATKAQSAARKLSETLEAAGFEGERLKAALDFATVSDVTYQTPIAGFSEGDHVMWPTSQGIACGKIKHIAAEGTVRGDGKTTVRATTEEPAARIEVHRKGKPTGVHVAHKLSRLRKLDPEARQLAEMLKECGFKGEKLRKALEFALAG